MQAHTFSLIIQQLIAHKTASVTPWNDYLILCHFFAHLLINEILFTLLAECSDLTSVKFNNYADSYTFMGHHRALLKVKVDLNCRTLPKYFFIYLFMMRTTHPKKKCFLRGQVSKVTDANTNLGEPCYVLVLTI